MLFLRFLGVLFGLSSEVSDDGGFECGRIAFCANQSEACLGGKPFCGAAFLRSAEIALLPFTSNRRCGSLNDASDLLNGS